MRVARRRSAERRRAHARVRARAAHQRRRPPLPRRRRARAAADRGRRARARDRPRARRDQHRAPVGRDARSCSRPSGSWPTRRERRGDPALRARRREGWHPGVIGIVASRLVERYHRPCVLIALDGRGQRPRLGAQHPPLTTCTPGSRACAEHLVRFGGHRMAAGLEIEARQRRAVPARARRARARARSTRRTWCPSSTSTRSSPATRRARAGRGARALRPFGMGNPGVNLLRARCAGLRRAADGGGRATRGSRSPPAGARARAVAFGVGQGLATRPRTVADGGRAPRHDVVARLELNEWEGSVEPRLVLRSLHALPERAERRRRCRLVRDCSCGCAAATGSRRCGASASGWLAARLGRADAPAARTGAHADRRRPPRRGRARRARRPAQLRPSPCWSPAPTSRGAARCSSGALAPERFGRPRCSAVSRALRAATSPSAVLRTEVPDRVLCVADHACDRARPALAASFHARLRARPAVASLDHACVAAPRTLPATRDGRRRRRLVPALGWGDAEVEFALRGARARVRAAPCAAAALPRACGDPGGPGRAGAGARARRRRAPPAHRAQAARCLRGAGRARSCRGRSLKRYR